jgi:hypothetical protein
MPIVDAIDLNPVGEQQFAGVLKGRACAPHAFVSSE